MGCGSSRDVVDNSLRTVNDPKANVTEDKSTNNNVIKEETGFVLANESPRFKIGDRVHVRGYVGTVKYQGKTKLGEGKWIGIELEKPHPQGNNGAFQEITYFSCKPKHGLIVRPEAVFHHKQELENELSKISPETIVFIQNKMRRMLAKIRLGRLQERSGNEKIIDKHVINTPVEEEESPNRLGIYLTKPFTRSRDKAFAIYRWLTFNIDYDVDGFFGRSSKKSCLAEDVLASKSSVCAGYANLFEAMGKAAGLEIHVISGYAKGYGYQPGQKIQGTNHAWNAIRIEDQWYLSDATWGAGYIGNDMMFHREPSSYRFLMDPEYAIFDHLPEDNKWQFLDEPVTNETFADAAVMSGEMYSMGIELLSHKKLLYAIDNDSIDMTFYCPGKKMVLMGNIKSSSDERLSDGRERVQIRPCGINQVKLRAQFPAPGSYTINIYVKVDGSWTQGTSYIIKTTMGCGDNKGGFPQISGNLNDNGFDIVSPIENIETNNGKAEIRLSCYSKRFLSISGNVLGATEMEKNMIKNYCLCLPEKTNDGFCLKVDTPGPGTYILNIFAKKDDGKSLFLCKYYITNTEVARRDVIGFPRLSDDFHTFKLELMEPQENVITLDGRLELKIKGTDISTISFNCSLQPDLGTALQLQPNQQLCFYKKCDDEVTIQIDAPVQGLYTLNIFGSQQGMPEPSKQVWLCTYRIYSKNKLERPVFGFPRLSPEFAQWGLVLVEPKENIHSRDGHAQIVMKCTDKDIDLLCNLKQNQKGLDKLCNITSNDDKKIISIKLSEGLFNLNIFGKREGDNQYTYLLSYLMKSDGPSH